ncbi:MAG: hypothetical protein AAFO96_21435 [Bacteroidota bacterium]
MGILHSGTSEGYTSYTMDGAWKPPKQAFLNPQLLMSYWGNDPIPLNDFSEQEIEIQYLLNEKENFVVTETPQSEDGLAPLDRDYGLIDQDVITPYTWKWIELKLPRKDGVILKVKLRRPNWWLIQSGLTELGATIPLSLGEMEADGVARLVRIWPNQLDMRLVEAKKNLQPIISVYKHKSPETWDYVLDLGPDLGRDTLAATPTHPFWSVESDRWMQIGHIPPGEHVSLKDQQQAQMLSKHRRATKGEYVYNFEVYKDHHYFVGEGLAWVHNCETWKTISESQGLTRAIEKAYGKNAVEVFEMDIKTRLATGKLGGNIHRLKGDLKGWQAIDIPGTGKGRGAGRIVFRELGGEIEIKGLVKGHDYGNIIN